MIKAEIVGHSLSPQKDELISVLATFPRIILAEVNTHRMLSKNTSSSRAIPFNKMVEAIETNPFIPIAFQKEHSGMQGTEYWEGTEHDLRVEIRKEAIARSVYNAKEEHKYGVTKQLVNRHLEPHMWTTMLITGSREGWENFFKLRCPQYEIYAGPEDIEEYLCTGRSWKDFMKSNKGLAGDFDTDNVVEKLKLNKGQAEIHMMALAECIWDATNESTPKQLEPGEWHIPFKDKIKIDDFLIKDNFDNIDLFNQALEPIKLKISVAMAARTSYTVVGEEKGIDYENLIGLHDRLLTQDPPHSSPMEHCARAMNEEEYFTNVKGIGFKNGGGLCFKSNSEGWCYNLKGFIPYRYFVDNGLVI
jgi:hypothetical protein